MTSEGSLDLKEVLYIPGSVQTDLLDLPMDVRLEASLALNEIQNGQRWSDSKALKGGKLGGIEEIRINFDTDTYRVFYIAKFQYAVYVIDADIKKSASGGQINKDVQARLEARKKAAEEHYKTNETVLKVRFLHRLERRKARNRLLPQDLRFLKEVDEQGHSPSKRK
jgi:phage-related protein